MRTLFLLLFFTVSLSAQTIKVVDLETGNPIPNLFIYCDSSSAITNTKGEAFSNDFTLCKDINFQHRSYTTTSFTLEQIKSKNYTVYMERAFISLATAEVNFNKWEQDKSEIPISIAEIKKKDIDFQNPQTTADLLAQSGKVFIQKSQLGGGSPMIRGFSTSRVLLVVDGVRMNNAIFREGNVQNVISLDPNAIEKSEIIFGPGSVVYGSDAIGGVMDFHTLQPKYSFDGKSGFSLGYMGRYTSANEEKTAHVHFSIGNKKLASLTSFTFTDYDDQIMGSNGPDDYLRTQYQGRINNRDTVLNNPNSLQQIGTGFSQLNFMQKFRYRLSKASELSYGFHYSISSDIPRYDRLSQYSGVDTLRQAEWYYGPQIWIMNNLHYSYNHANAMFDKLKLTAAFQQFEESRNDRRLYSNNLRSRTEKVNASSISIDFEKNINSNSEFFYGAEYVFNRVNSEGFTQNILSGDESPTSTRYPDGSTWQYGSMYSNFKHKINPKLTLNAGTRINYVRLNGTIDTSFFPFPFNSIENNFFATNGSFGLSYLPAKTWQLNTNISNGFRAPNIDDVSKIFDSEPGSVVIPNTDLKPEYLYSLDVSILKTHSDWLQVELGAYYSYLQNALVRDDFTLNGQDSIVYDNQLSNVEAVQNKDAAYVWGVQGAVKFQFNKLFELSSNLHYNYGRSSDDEPLRHVAPLFGSTHFIYAKDKTKIDLYGVYNGSINFENLAPNEADKAYLYAADDNGNPYSPSWYTLNVRIEQELSKKLVLQIGLDNITDIRYRTYSSGIAAPGRSISLTIRGNI